MLTTVFSRFPCLCLWVFRANALQWEMLADLLCL